MRKIWYVVWSLLILIFILWYHNNNISIDHNQYPSCSENVHAETINGYASLEDKNNVVDFVLSQIEDAWCYTSRAKERRSCVWKVTLKSIELLRDDESMLDELLLSDVEYISKYLTNLWDSFMMFQDNEKQLLAKKRTEQLTWLDTKNIWINIFLGKDFNFSSDSYRWFSDLIVKWSIDGVWAYPFSHEILTIYESSLRDFYKLYWCIPEYGPVTYRWTWWAWHHSIVWLYTAGDDVFVKYTIWDGWGSWGTRWYYVLLSDSVVMPFAVWFNEIPWVKYPRTIFQCDRAQRKWQWCRYEWSDISFGDIRESEKVSEDLRLSDISHIESLIREYMDIVYTLMPLQNMRE